MKFRSLIIQLFSVLSAEQLHDIDTLEKPLLDLFQVGINKLGEVLERDATPITPTTIPPTTTIGLLDYMFSIVDQFTLEDANTMLSSTLVPLKNDVRFTSYEEHQFVQTSKSLIRFNFNQHWYRCDLHNFHGILVDDEFLRIKDSQCGKDDQKKFMMKPEVLEKFRIDF